MPNPTFSVTGGYGEMIVDYVTGVVIEHDGYDDIARIDVGEMHWVYAEEFIPGESWDIIFTSYWTDKGVYIGSASCRKDYAENVGDDSNTWVLKMKTNPGTPDPGLITMEQATDACAIWEHLLEANTTLVLGAVATREICCQLAPAFGRIQEIVDEPMDELIPQLIPFINWKNPAAIYESIEEIACSVSQ